MWLIYHVGLASHVVGRPSLDRYEVRPLHRESILATDAEVNLCRWTGEAIGPPLLRQLVRNREGINDPFQ